jgi:hypothetical protein
VIRAFAWLLVAAWVAFLVAALLGKASWWGVLLSLIWALPAIGHVAPPRKSNRNRRNLVLFRTSLVDEETFVNGELLPSGRGALEAIGQALRDRQLAAGPVVRDRFYAWSIYIDRCEVLIQGDEGGDEALIVTVTGRAFEPIVSAIESALTSDPRFFDVRVLTERQLVERPT